MNDQAFEKWWCDIGRRHFLSIGRYGAWVIWSAGAEQMRERAAQLCEGAPLPEGYDHNDTAFYLAEAIRALPIGAPQEKP